MKSVNDTDTEQKPAKQQQPRAQARQDGATRQRREDGRGDEPESAIELITFDEDGKASDEKAQKSKPQQPKANKAKKRPQSRAGRQNQESQKPAAQQGEAAQREQAPVQEKTQQPQADKPPQQRTEAEQAPDIDETANQDPYQAAQDMPHPEQLANPYQAAAEPERKLPLDQIMIKVSLSPNADEQPKIETQVISAEDQAQESEADEEEQAAPAAQAKSDSQPKPQATAQPETLPYPNFNTPNLAYPGPEDAANLQPMILEQLEQPQEIEIEPMVPPSVVQQAYGMEPVPAAQEPKASKKPQPVHLSEMNEPRSQANQPDEDQAPDGEDYDDADEDEDEAYDGEESDLDTDDDEDTDFEDEEDDDFADGDEDMDDIEGQDEGSEGEMADKKPQVRMQQTQPADGESIGASILTAQQDAINADRVRRDFAAHGEFPSQDEEFESVPEEQQTVMASVSNQDWQKPEAYQQDDEGDDEDEAGEAPEQAVSEQEDASEDEDPDSAETETEPEMGSEDATEDASDADEDSERELTAEEKWEQKKERLHQQYAEKVHQRALDIQKDPHAVVREIMQRMLSSDHSDDRSKTVDLASEKSTARSEDRKIADVMTRKVVCALDTISIEQLAGIFNQRKLTAVPILDSYTHHFVGLMTMETLFSQAFSQKMFDSRDPSTGETGQGTQLMQRPVKDFLEGLDKSQIQVAPDFSLDEACDLMLENQLKHLVVIEKGEVKGIFSAFDALRLVEGRHHHDPDAPGEANQQPSVVKQASRPSTPKGQPKSEKQEKKGTGRQQAA